ncbi:minor tail protein [Gordonia phage UmaThurman]|uniref:minor tail protein n=1 Tax=Gordonia phage UmaThurman TaxID=1821563 RepID=UPI00078C1137|nr:minor tail protein [Gordonia phage UmaThurman]AMS03930.1 minor tail protein [Gordonia phage UmaThurman]
MADITYMTVTGLWTHIVDDGIVDGDPNPDVVHPMGKVVFAPKPSNTGFVTAGAAGESESVTLAEVPALIADGVLTDLQGNDGVRLAATIGGNPVRWVAQPTLMYGKKTLPSKAVTFDPPTVGTTLHLNDLFDDIGPQSPLVTTEVKAYRDQAVAARDEAQQIVDDIAVGVVPDSGVAARVTQPGQTKTALDNTYAPATRAVPTGGATGQVLTKTSGGTAWQTPPSGGGGGDGVSATAVNVALAQRTLAPVVEVVDSTDEWWISPIATQLSWPYPRIVKASYSQTGGMLASESVPGVLTKTIEAFDPGWAIDDHDAPWLFAEDRHRLVMGSSHHGEYKYLDIVVSDRDGSIESLATNPVTRFQMSEYTFTHTNYGQCHRIEHLSTVDAYGAPLVDHFWLFVRAGDTWDIIDFTVHQHTGVVTIVDRRPFLQGQNLQWYCTTVSAHDPSGQKIRVGAYANPSSWQHAIWYVEIDVETGIVTCPTVPGLNHDIESGVLQAFNATTGPGFAAALAQPATGISRRLLAIRPGPAAPAILWAEWPESSPNVATYYLTTLSGGAWSTVSMGAAGPRFGYTSTSNYLAGGCFPNPCYTDELYLARNADPSVVERSYINRAGTRVFETVASSEDSVLIRPHLAYGGSAAKVMFTALTDYSDTGFTFAGTCRSVAENAGITALGTVQVPDLDAPSVPSGVSAAPVAGAAIVSFTASTDNVGVDEYRVYSSADGYTAVIATGASSPITAPSPNGVAASFRVDAVDAAGNASAKSSASNSVTPQTQDEILPGAGALLLIDPANPHQAWAPGVPTGTVTNLARAQAVAAAGAGVAGDFDLTVANTLTPTDGVISRTGKGGLYGLISQTTDVADRAFRLSSEALRKYFADHPTNDYFLSAWVRPVRRSTMSPPLFFTAWVGPRGAGTVDLMCVREVTSYKLGGAPSTNRSMVIETATPAPLETPARAGGAWTALQAAHATDATMLLMGIPNVAGQPTTVHKAASWIFYRAYIEDLTVSQRSAASVAALDQQLYNAAFDPGGRYNADTYDAASTLP